jgi:hypothetical protein
LETGVFPNRFIWKKAVKSAISLFDDNEWTKRTHIDPDFTRFIQLHDGKGLPRIWKVMWTSQETKIIKTLAKLWTIPPSKNICTCQLCNSECNDLFKHISCSCPFFNANRDQFWNDLTNFDLCICAEFCALDEEDFYNYVLGKKPIYPLSEQEEKHLLLLCGNYLVKVFALYKRNTCISQ